MNKITNPHDRFFKTVFANSELVKDFFYHYLPPEITALLNLDSLVLQESGFIDHQLLETSSDLLFLTQTKKNEQVYVYLLFEHKSQPEPLVSFQLLRYMIRIWERDCHENLGLPFRWIVPLVVYHGETSWNVSSDFRSLFDRSEEMRVFIPNYEYRLFDFHRLREQEIVGEAEMRAAILLMKYIYSEDLGVKLDLIFELAGKLKNPNRILEFLETMVQYLVNSPIRITKKSIEESLKKTFTQGDLNIMPTIAEQWIQEGIEKGLEKGLEKGKVEGILISRFGSVSPDVHERIFREDDINRLQAWGRYALQTFSMEEFLHHIDSQD